MAILLGCDSVSLEFPTKHIFDNVTLGVDEGDRIGIVGKNGDGKSTLLSVLAGYKAMGRTFRGIIDVNLRQYVMLGDAASPVALFTIGAVLSRSGRANRAAGRDTPPSLYLPVAAIKLLLHPALVFGLAAGARWLGAPLSQGQVVALTLAAALPSASNVSLLTERFGAHGGRVARIILVSTALAFVSFSLVVDLLLKK